MITVKITFPPSPKFPPGLPNPPLLAPTILRQINIHYCH